MKSIPKKIRSRKETLKQLRARMKSGDDHSQSSPSVESYIENMAQNNKYHPDEALTTFASTKKSNGEQVNLIVS